MSQKRCAEEVLVQQPRFKRQYGLPSPQTTRDPRAEASAEFLKNFVLTCGPGATGVNDLVWQCFGELNVLLRTNSRRLRDVPLAGYTSLTRCAKAAAFNKLLSAEHLHPDELQHRYPPHVCAISVMLRRFFHSHDEASLCRYTVQTQDWMRPWCNKWGFNQGTISLWTVNAYSSQVYEPQAVHGGELIAGVESLHSTLFCPIIPA